MQRPVLARILPFAVYMAFLALEQGAGEWLEGFDPRWLYPVKVAVVAGVLWYFRAEYRELLTRPGQRGIFISLLLGALVFVAWINLDRGWLDLGGGMGYDPRDAGGNIDWTMALMRLTGAALVVPPWKSFSGVRSCCAGSNAWIFFRCRRLRSGCARS